MSKKLKTAAIATGALLGTTYLVMRHIANKQYPHSVYADQPEEQNPVEGKKVFFVEDENDPENADGKKGHLEAVGKSEHNPTFYEKYIKRGMDIVLSFGGMVVLAPIYAVTALAIKVDDPGPVLFKQKRVAQNKGYFQLLKFRSMSVNTPKDVPTHMLQNGGITKVGAFIRKASIDELPQLWNIFRGNMSVIGPRPALWNQDYLTAERDKYGANDVKPGLTGLAQISGRDELEIEKKATLDGEYAKALKKSSLSGFLMDAKVFFGSISSVLHSNGVVEGGTGTLKKKTAKIVNSDYTSYHKHEPISIDGCDSKFNTEKLPLVSVVVATYHRNKGLYSALKSLAKQTYSNIEIIIVSDNANERWNTGVCSIVDQIHREYPNLSLELILNKTNKGSAQTRNIGIKHAKGKYITFLDDDDVYLPNKIKEQLLCMLYNDSDYSITDLYLYDEKGRLIDKRVRSYMKAFDSASLIRYHLMYHLTGTDTMMFKATYLNKIGGFSSIDVGDEFYLMEKAIRNDGIFSYLPRCDVKAYVHSTTEGLSSGESKRLGEERLYSYKQQYYAQLDKKTRKYIDMRHHAVLAFSYLREKQLIEFTRESICAVFSSPFGAVKLITNMI